MTRLRVASLNLRAYPNPKRSTTERLAQLIADQEPDIALLQECRKGWLEMVCEMAGLRGIYSHDVEPALAFPPDGCGIAVRPPFRIEATRRIAPERFQPGAIGAAIPEDTPAGYEEMPERLACRYSARTLLAELSADGQRFTVGSFHATPGTGKVGGARVHEWKPFFHGGVALALAELDTPFLFAIDANEPLSEASDSVTFHWADGDPGQRKLVALLGLAPEHRARDLLRESLTDTGESPAAARYLTMTYSVGGDDGGRRFDSIWATPDFQLARFETHYEEAVAAGGDHALLVADLTL
jgi:hypothetical protein